MTETSDRRRQIETPFGPCQELMLEHFLGRVLPPLRHGIDPARIVAAMKTSGRASFNKTITKTVDGADSQETPRTVNGRPTILSSIRRGLSLPDMSLRVNEVVKAA